MVRPFQLGGQKKGTLWDGLGAFRAAERHKAEVEKGRDGQEGRLLALSKGNGAGGTRRHVHMGVRWHVHARALRQPLAPCRWVSAGADGAEGNTAPTSHLHPRGAGEHLGLTVSVTNMHMNKTRFTLCPGLQMDIRGGAVRGSSLKAEPSRSKPPGGQRGPQTAPAAWSEPTCCCDGRCRASGPGPTASCRGQAPPDFVRGRGHPGTQKPEDFSGL